MNIKTGYTPSWGSFVQFEAQRLHFPIVALAAQCGVPRGTIATSLGTARGVRRPRKDTAQKIGRGLHVPSVAVCALTDYVAIDPWERHVGVAFEGATKTINRSDLVYWWSANGGQYLARSRRVAGLTLEQTAAAWNQRWSMLPVDPNEWGKLETDGTVPTAWQQSSHAMRLDVLPGAWIWAVLLAANGDRVLEPDDYSDYIGLLLVLGRLFAIGESTIRSWDAESYPLLVQIFQQHYNEENHSLNVDAVAYSVRAMSFPLPVPVSVRPEHQDPFAGAVGLIGQDFTEQESALIARWRALSATQQKATYQVIDDLAKARVR